MLGGVDGAGGAPEARVEKVVDKLVDDLLAPIKRTDVLSASPLERASERHRRGGPEGQRICLTDH